MQYLLKKIKNINQSQKVRFIKNGIYIWSIGQLVLHLSLLIISIPLSVFISNVTSIPIRYYFYGKNVFGLKNPNLKTGIKFLIFSIMLWIFNTLGISIIHSYGLNKNISAIFIIPIVAFISFILQKYFVFK